MGFNAPYAASKHAIEAVGDALRVELHSSGVQVGLIEPGSIATPIWDKSRGEADRHEDPARAAGSSTGTCRRRWTRFSPTPAAAGIAPDVVAEAIEKSLTASRMPSRTLVGRDARAMLDRQAAAARSRLRPHRARRIGI